MAITNYISWYQCHLEAVEIIANDRLESRENIASVGNHFSVLAIALANVTQEGHGIGRVSDFRESVLEGLVIGVLEDQESPSLLVVLTILESIINGELVSGFSRCPVIGIRGGLLAQLLELLHLGDFNSQESTSVILGAGERNEAVVNRLLRAPVLAPVDSASITHELLGARNGANVSELNDHCYLRLLLLFC